MLLFMNELKRHVNKRNNNNYYYKIHYDCRTGKIHVSEQKYTRQSNVHRIQPRQNPVTLNDLKPTQ
jgi:hypothetical protein